MNEDTYYSLTFYIYKKRLHILGRMHQFDAMAGYGRQQFYDVDYQHRTVIIRRQFLERKVLYDMAGMYKKQLPTWKDLKHTQLLDEKQKVEEQKWDQEFIRRQHELEKQKQMSDQRRTRSSAKLTDLSARWRHLERKRVEKSACYLERLRTNLSITLRAESMSSGSPFSER